MARRELSLTSTSYPEFVCYISSPMAVAREAEIDGAESNLLYARLFIYFIFPFPSFPFSLSRSPRDPQPRHLSWTQKKEKPNLECLSDFRLCVLNIYIFFDKNKN